MEYFEIFQNKVNYSEYHAIYKRFFPYCVLLNFFQNKILLTLYKNRQTSSKSHNHFIKKKNYNLGF